MDELETLIERVQHGDEAAYAHVVARCEARVRLAVAAIVHHREAVSDVAQETFVTAYSKLGEYRAGTNFHAWVATIARNLARNQRTRYLRRLACEREYEAQVAELMQPEVDRLSAWHDEEALPALRQCVAEIPSPAREVLESF